MRNAIFAGSILALSAIPAAASEPPACFDQGESAPGFGFQLSKAAQIRSGEVDAKRSDRRGLDFTSTVSADTIVEKSGRKRSHRSEIRETVQSSVVTRGDEWQCYEFSLMVAEGSALPARERNGKRAKLTVAQFHQERTGAVSPSAVIFFDVDPRGHLLFEFSERLGSRKKVLVKNILGRWLEIRVAARWSTKRGEGRTQVWIRERGDSHFDKVIDAKGKNSTTGHVYQKLGAYRSFIERDTQFASREVTVHYSNVRRNGRPATFR